MYTDILGEIANLDASIFERIRDLYIRCTPLSHFNGGTL